MKASKTQVDSLVRPAKQVATVIGLITGHLLGGPDSEDRTVLALATAARHPGVAMAIASANFPEQKLAPAAILLYLLLSALLSIPYVMWRRRHGEIGAVMRMAKE
jgi:hypothetical protein